MNKNEENLLIVRSWRRLHRRSVLLAVAAFFMICAIGLAAWYWLLPRVYEAKRSLMLDCTREIRYGGLELRSAGDEAVVREVGRGIQR